MEGFEWAENNLDAVDPHSLQESGVQVYFAPNIVAGEKVVDLGTGRIDLFYEEEKRPLEGYYAQWESLERYCRANGIPLHETEGHAVALPVE